tara:strand:- start:26 stop:715 length:690 start_codon:yes stop_codon:yes gene_type:complete
MLVPAGGFSLETGKWIGFRKKYLASEEALSLNFRNIFMENIKKLALKGALKIPPSLGYLEHNYADFLDFFNKPHSKGWHVHVQKPFGCESQVIKYLGRYINRTAISNSRILDVSEGKVSFSFKNYRTHNMTDVMSLGVDVFVRRFANCIMPKGFQNIRHAGAYGNTVKKENVFRARLFVYGTFGKPVSILKEVYKIESTIKKIMDSISICGKCSCELEQKSSLEYLNTA